MKNKLNSTKELKFGAGIVGYKNLFEFSLMLSIQLFRPITPIHETYYSYAVAFVNRRTDGTPSDVAVTLRELGKCIA